MKKNILIAIFFIGIAFTTTTALTQTKSSTQAKPKPAAVQNTAKEDTTTYTLGELRAKMWADLPVKLCMMCDSLRFQMKQIVEKYKGRTDYTNFDKEDRVKFETSSDIVKMVKCDSMCAGMRNGVPTPGGW